MGVTLLAALVCIVGLANGWRAITYLARRPLLTDLEVTLPLNYAIVSGGVWCVVLLAAAVAVWRGNSRARWGASLALTGNLAHYWIDRYFYSQSDYSSLSAGFALGVCAIVIACAWAIALCLRRH